MLTYKEAIKELKHVAPELLDPIQEKIAELRIQAETPIIREIIKDKIVDPNPGLIADLRDKNQRIEKLNIQIDKLEKSIERTDKNRTDKDQWAYYCSMISVMELLASLDENGFMRGNWENLAHEWMQGKSSDLIPLDRRVWLLEAACTACEKILPEKFLDAIAQGQLGDKQQEIMQDVNLMGQDICAKMKGILKDQIGWLMLSQTGMDFQVDIIPKRNTNATFAILYDRGECFCVVNAAHEMTDQKTFEAACESSYTIMKGKNK